MMEPAKEQQEFSQNQQFQQPPQQQQQFQQQPQQFQQQPQPQFVQQPGQPVAFPQQQQQIVGMVPVAIPVNGPPAPQDLQNITIPFGKLKRRLNCWWYVLVVFIILGILGFINVRGDYAGIQIVARIIGLLDTIFWTLGVYYGKQALNQFYFDELPKLALHIKISIFFSTLSLLGAIGLFFVGEVWATVVAVVSIILYFVFLWVRIKLFIQPGNELALEIKALKEKYPDNSPTPFNKFIQTQFPFMG